MRSHLLPIPPPRPIRPSFMTGLGEVVDRFLHWATPARGIAWFGSEGFVFLVLGAFTLGMAILIYLNPILP